MPRKYHYTKKTGRPTKYRPDYCTSVVQFFRDRSGPGRPMVTLLAFCESIGVTYNAIEDWQAVYPDFQRAIKTAMHYQEQQLGQQGLEGVWNPAMSIFLLKNNHGYRDRHDVEHGGTVTVNLIDTMRQVAARRMPVMAPPEDLPALALSGNGHSPA